MSFIDEVENSNIEQVYYQYLTLNAGSCYGINSGQGKIDSTEFMDNARKYWIKRWICISNSSTEMSWTEYFYFKLRKNNVKMINKKIATKDSTRSYCENVAFLINVNQQKYCINKEQKIRAFK